MPVYAFGPQQNKPTQGQRAAEVGNAIADVYAPIKAKQEMERDFANFDNLPKVQQAMVLAKYAGQPAAAAHVKSVGQQQAVQRFLGNTTAPNTSQLQNAMQAANVENMNQLGAANVPAAMTQPQTPTAPGMNRLAQKSDEELRTGLFEVPELTAPIKAELEARDTARKEKTKQAIADRKFMLDVDKKSDAYDNEIQKEAKTARRHLQATAVARKAIESGKVEPKSFEGLARTLFKGSAWENYFKNPEVALLEAASLSDYEGMKDLFGTRLSDADLKTASGKVISPEKSPEANLAIIDYREFQDRMKIAESEIADQIKEENGGFKPINFPSQVRKRMQEQYGDEAEQIVKKVANEGQPSLEPNELDPLMISSYGEIEPGMIRLKKGSEVIDVQISMLNDAVNDGYHLLEQGA